jgi:hypothetical protein
MPFTAPSGATAVCAFETSSRCRESNVERTSIATVRVVFGGRRAFLAYPVGLVSALSGPPIASRRFEAQHTLLDEVPNVVTKAQ